MDTGHHLWRWKPACDNQILMIVMLVAREQKIGNYLLYYMEWFGRCDSNGSNTYFWGSPLCERYCAEDPVVPVNNSLLLLG